MLFRSSIGVLADLRLLLRFSFLLRPLLLLLLDLSAKPVIKPLKKQALRECLLLAYTVFVFVWFKVFDFSAKYTGNLSIIMRSCF